MIRLVIAVAAACFLVIGAAPLPHPASFAVYAQDDWEAEFEDICSKTENPMALTTEEIRSLVERCDKLKPRIERLDESAAKVYLKRLKMCKDLFAFVLESKSK